MDNKMADEMEEDFDDENECDEESSISENFVKTAITGRGVTLQMLIIDGIIEPGNGLLTLKYLGRKFIADLLPNGKIMTPATKEMFGTPSAWAAHCKRQVNPLKKSGCGWNSVMYKGKKLDMWKTSWFRKHRPGSPARRESVSPRVFMMEQNGERPGSAASIQSNHSDRPKVFDFSNLARGVSKDHNDQQNGRSQNGQVSNSATEFKAIPPPIDLSVKSSMDNGNDSAHRSPGDNNKPEIQEEALNLSMKEPEKKSTKIETGNKEARVKQMVSVHHSNLRKGNQDLKPGTFVLCESFKSLGKTQPFTVSLSTNVLLLMDFHCHLTSNEVVGYLGGTWNTQTQHLSIIDAFPCKSHLSDGHKSADVEEEIKRMMKRRGLSLVGWYHSHPCSQPDPSIRDIGCQMSYQLRMKGSGATYYPCVGIITSPFHKVQSSIDSSYNMFMVMPPLEEEPADCGIPMKVAYVLNQNQSVTEELLSEMKKVRDFYRGTDDWINFNHSWQSSIKYIDKLKESLSRKLPADQMDSGTLLDFVEHLVLNN
ncbi:MPN domain-containing protein-like isoform X1 [Mytilus trossulus]|uniref:MPN domain-containing protein-like isoform X1 n=2 Tax=Mytilus trossulus TaxID=6551 RepID=UPI003003E092